MAIGSQVPGVAVVTGAASGIGRAVSLAFAQAGASGLALLDINAAGLEETKSLILSHLSSANLPATRIECISCDVTSPSSITSAYTNAKTSLGRLDYSIHCAGIITFGSPSVLASVDDFDRQNAINYRGLWLCARAALTIMRDQPLDSESYPDAHINPVRAQRGSIVNISSGLARLSMKACPAYCGAKAGVCALTRSDAIDYVADRIRVNAVLPGIVDTPITAPTKEQRALLEGPGGPVQRTPMLRMGLPEEIADTVVFLAGNKGSFITGAEIVVDGGSTAC